MGRDDKANKVAWIELPERLRQPIAALRDQVFMATRRGKKNQKLIGVGGYSKREGVTTVVANLAVSLAEIEEARVLLVDANFNDPKIHEVFKVRLSPGLMEGAETGEFEIINLAPGLDVLTCGKRSISSASRLDGTKFQAGLADWRQAYSYVLFDLPPLGEVSEGYRLARLIDGMVMVVKAELNKEQEINQVKSRLVKSGVPIIGMVFNG